VRVDNIKHVCDDSPQALTPGRLEQQMATAKFNPQAIAERIERNVADVDTGRISWAEFSQRNRAAWDEASRGELCIIGSAASRRVQQVHKALNGIPQVVAQ
jgi:hypothetical protein